MNQTELLSPRELSIRSGWPEKRIRTLLLDGKLKHVRIGVNYLLPIDAITDFVERNMIKPWDDTTKEQSSSKNKKG